MIFLSMRDIPISFIGSNAMKVLFIAPQPFFRVRGTPINVRNVVTALAEAGHEVDLLCYPMGEDIRLPGVNIIRSPRVLFVRDVKVGPSLAKIPLDILMFFRAAGRCARRRYDVIHAVEEAAFFAVWLKKLFKTRMIYDMDSAIADQLQYTGFLSFRPLLRLAERLEQAAMKSSDFVMTVCESLSDYVRRHAPSVRIVQIEDAPLQSSFLEDRAGADRLRREWMLENHPCVVYTGNFESYQGIDMLLKAAGHVLKKESEVRFVLVGGEPAQVSRAETLAGHLDIRASCVFTGKRPMEDMPAFMTLADVLVSPRTQGANTALKIYTYMQSGKPIVATKLPTHTQVLDAESAILVNPDPHDLSSGILRALREPLLAESLGRSAQALVARKYSLASFKHKVRDAYHLLDEHELNR